MPTYRLSLTGIDVLVGSEASLGFRSLVDVGQSTIRITDNSFPVLFRSMKSLQKLDVATLWAVGTMKPNITAMVSTDGGYEWVVRSFPFDFLRTWNGSQLVPVGALEPTWISGPMKLLVKDDQTAWIGSVGLVYQEEPAVENLVLKTDDGGSSWFVASFDGHEEDDSETIEFDDGYNDDGGLVIVETPNMTNYAIGIADVADGSLPIGYRYEVVSDDADGLKPNDPLDPDTCVPLNTSEPDWEKNMSVQNLKTELVVEPRSENGEEQVAENQLGAVGAVLLACWDPPPGNYCFDYYQVELFENNDTNRQAIKDERGFSPVPEFYLAPSQGHVDLTFYKDPVRKVQPYVRNCIESTVLQPEKSYVLSVKAIKWDYNRCSGGYCVPGNNIPFPAVLSKNITYEATKPTEQAFPAPRDCTSSVPSPPRNIYVNKVYITEYDDRIAELCWTRPSDDACVAGYTIYQYIANNIECPEDIFGADSWCEPRKYLSGLPDTISIEGQEETCYNVSDISQSSLVDRDVSGETWKHRIVVRAHQALIRCVQEVGCTYNSPASVPGRWGSNNRTTNVDTNSATFDFDFNEL